MKTSRYSRNRIYLSNQDQQKIQSVRILIGGLGLGSVIAECALRMGFEKLLLIDGDQVEESNLNRQNYTATDIGNYKAEALLNRLKAINTHADIQYLSLFLNQENVNPLLNQTDIAINAFDFTSDFPFTFDQMCIERQIPVLHPYNFGWAGLVTVVDWYGSPLTLLSSDFHGFELTFAKYIHKKLKLKGQYSEELERIITNVTDEEGEFPPPQLSVGSWITAGLCTRILFQITTGIQIKSFPDFYYLSTY